MKSSEILIVAALGLGAYVILTRNASAAAKPIYTAQQQQQQQGATLAQNANALLSLASGIKSLFGGGSSQSVNPYSGGQVGSVAGDAYMPAQQFYGQQVGNVSGDAYMPAQQFYMGNLDLFAASPRASY